jgi:gas vesicle protein GvpL/GvpF
MDTGVYVFCLSTSECLDSSGSLPGSSLGLERLFLQRDGNLCAVAKMVSLDEFCGPDAERRLEDPEWVTPRAIDHGRVIGEIFRDRAVLPVPFGTLFSSTQVLAVFLKRNTELINGFFDYAAGCEEWGIKALLDRDALKRSLTESIVALESAAVAPGLRYMRARRAEQMAEQQSSVWLDQKFELLASALDQCATRSSSRRILDDSEQSDGREEILNLAALLARDRVIEFNSRIEAINRECVVAGLRFELTGPWPPYSFCPALETPS